jgi:hypothetical protein
LKIIELKKAPAAINAPTGPVVAINATTTTTATVTITALPKPFENALNFCQPVIFYLAELLLFSGLYKCVWYSSINIG